MSKHDLRHHPHGDPCSTCGRAAHRHHPRDRRQYMRDRRAKSGAAPRLARSTAADAPKKREKARIIALDGEGFTTKDGRHLYCYIAAGTVDGLVDDIYDPNGLSTKAIFDFLLRLPPGPKKIGFSLGYDRCKWLEDLDSQYIYDLDRPDVRAGKYGPRPVEVRLDGKSYKVNLVSTRFSLSGEFVELDGQRARARRAEQRKGAKFARTCVVYDVFKFYQCSFVKALGNWKVGTPEQHARIQRMKNKRGSFKGIGEAEKRYCREEVTLLAQLGEKLLTSAEEIGIELHDLFGPGSLAAAMLKRDKANDFRAMPRMDRDAIAWEEASGARFESREAAIAWEAAVKRAFAGGRFEITRCGLLPRASSRDIASAYPCGECMIPCLRCGHWRLVREDVDRAVKRARVALVHWTLPEHPRVRTLSRIEAIEAGHDVEESDVSLGPLERSRIAPDVALGPFFFRLENGDIIFPATAKGGWCWSFEYLAALKHRKRWPNVRAREAWIYESDCDCGYPFRESVADAYIKRLEWGKDGKGLTMKLAINSRAGKRAQTVGSAPFRDHAIAGMINSYCRAAIIDAIGRAKDPWSIASISTDGIVSTEPLDLPGPPRTGTEARARALGKSALGEWEEKPLPRGLFIARPGMRFSPDLGEAGEATTAARGVGVRTLHAARRKVLHAWKKCPRAPVKIKLPDEFNGSKLSITLRGRTTDSPTPHRTEDEHGRPIYGRWMAAKPFNLSYDASPKRPGFVRDDDRMLCWALGDSEGESAPYRRKTSLANTHVRQLQEAEDRAEAQPDREHLGDIIEGAD